MKRHQHQRPRIELEARPVTRRGTAYRRIIARASDERREYELHATKGYRSYRKSA